ncbi:LysR family transcriptional regulator [Sphingobium limneticum]|uniref:LysR family transcriptional regulator n=1 Tax=Sphingobium limneticum TaxID=1007511 RepID=UPI001FE2C7FE|nr:LysR family transcriptional regulator [Sphingobium limneticum]
MEQQTSPAARDRAPVTDRVIDRAHWTPARQRLFLSVLLDSGHVSIAARAAGMSRSSAHRLRRKLAGTPFDQAWDRALAVHAHLMADPFAQPARAAPPQQP